MSNSEKRKEEVINVDNHEESDVWASTDEEDDNNSVDIQNVCGVELHFDGNSSSNRRCSEDSRKDKSTSDTLQ